MLILCFRLAAAIHAYLTFYMPTNRAVAWLRSPRGFKWAIPAALVATPTYLFAMSVCIVIIERGGPSYLNMLVMLFAWNALKFAVMGALGPVLAATSRYQRRLASASQLGVTPSLAQRPYGRCVLVTRLFQPGVGRNVVREGHDNQVRAS